MRIRSVRSFVKTGPVLAIAGIALCLGAGAFAPARARPDLAKELGPLEPFEPSPAGEVCSLAVSLGGTLLATGARGGVVQLWQASTRRPLARWQAHDGIVTALAFFPDSRGLLTAGADRTVRHWAIGDQAMPRKVWQRPVTALVTALAVAPDGRTVAVASGGRLVLHDNDPRIAGHAERGVPLRGGELSALVGPIRALAFAPDGRALAAGGGGDNVVRVWALGDGPPVLRLTLEGHTENWVRGLAYSANGCTLVSLDTEGLVLAWDRTGNCVGQTHVGPPPCLHAALGAGARLVLTVPGGEGPARLWRLPQRWWQSSPPLRDGVAGYFPNSQ